MALNVAALEAAIEKVRRAAVDAGAVLPGTLVAQLSAQFNAAGAASPLLSRLNSGLGVISGRSFLEAFQQQRALLTAFAEDNDREGAEQEPDAEALGFAGWTLPLWATIPQCRHIFQQIRQHEIDEIDAAFVEHYAEDNGTAANELFGELLAAPVLEHWHPLLRQCAATYRRRQYLVTVPSLLLVYEGAFGRAVKRFDSLVKVRRASTDARMAHRPGIRRLIRASIDGFSRTVFAASDFAANAPERINRHWTMHGRSRPDWTRADCLRLFQAIHTLSDEIETP